MLSIILDDEFDDDEFDDEKIFENIFNHTHISDALTRIYLKDIRAPNRPITDRLSFQEWYVSNDNGGFY
jgi:hypothetical protein